MKMSACCALLALVVFLSGCRLQQCCCTCVSYCDAGVLTTTNLFEDYPRPILESPDEEPVVETPRVTELPAVHTPAVAAPVVPAPVVPAPPVVPPRVVPAPTVEPSAVTPPAEAPPAAAPPAEAPPVVAPPARRATRELLLPLQFPRVFFKIRG
jgi:hypothetical protein